MSTGQLLIWNDKPNVGVNVGGASRGDYAQEKVKLDTDREAGLGHVRYIAIEHMEVRRDCSRFAQRLRIAARRASYSFHCSNRCIN